MVSLSSFFLQYFYSFQADSEGFFTTSSSFLSVLSLIPDCYIDIIFQFLSTALLFIPGYFFGLFYNVFQFFQYFHSFQAVSEASILYLLRYLSRGCTDDYCLFHSTTSSPIVAQGREQGTPGPFWLYLFRSMCGRWIRATVL